MNQFKHPVLKALTFLNLLEPDIPMPVISITKTSMWAALGLLIYMAAFHPTDPGGLGVALAGVAVSTGGYGWRRYVQYRSAKGSYGGGDECEEAECELEPLDK